MDATYLVVLGGDDGDDIVLERTAEAFVTPARTFGLGKLSLLPRHPVLLGLSELVPEHVVASYPLLADAPGAGVVRRVATEVEVRGPGPGVVVRYDEPLDYPSHRYTGRYVRRDHVEITENKEAGCVAVGG
jgi:hypothetical protein